MNNNFEYDIRNKPIRITRWIGVPDKFSINRVYGYDGYMDMQFLIGNAFYNPEDKSVDFKFRKDAIADYKISFDDIVKIKDGVEYLATKPMCVANLVHDCV